MLSLTISLILWACGKLPVFLFYVFIAAKFPSISCCSSVALA
ncbi:putative membrane protein [Escherichia coli P0305260.11]|uniref:Uncharacterized protein n=1 Tax=Escherichia coli O145:H28 (strain RM12581) TaxID=1248823 RepID=A0ABC8A170_ECOLR|nr:hypothetical protein ECRM13514_5367 [Escherichia coli O145:H28 str. RM13514]AHG16348.1 hypothetical protein ECRM13516_3719 [Escherichia coli O145:H28 str. RM13516]AHY66671.1 hypothetical protein ECRM12761_18170 [Escherichia coli O145:H28 str. RM12761]AHY73806.1 hypothetical protein ECRM12581_26380 [Escherichia coli O145:H28 str. RM12581]EGW86486.1 putative membrane protein [Escherichia coli 3030-1]EHW91122.1 putative membrane protein [Escherichia coli DEC10F]EMZ90446.1 putative membrane pr